MSMAEKQGFSDTSGNHRLRMVMVELAWLWQRYQPGAAQVAWFRDRAGST
jgi:transposase